MTPYEKLVAARELISDPSHWTQGCFARNKLGLTTDVKSADATCWCSVGALRKVSDDIWLTPAYDLLCAVLEPEERFYEYGLIAEFNDTYTHAEVLELFDEAIALAQEHKI